MGTHYGGDEALEARVDVLEANIGGSGIPLAQKGAPGGVATLDEDGVLSEAERPESVESGSGGLTVLDLGGNLGATEEIPTSGDSVHARGAILNANCAITTIGKPAGEARRILISGVQDGTGGRTITVDGVAVAIPSAAGAGWEVAIDWDGTDEFVYFPGGSGIQGPQGEQGIQGEPGTPGAPGADGDDGDPGAPGADGVISEVQNGGTPLADQPILNVTGAGKTLTVSGGKYVLDIPGGAALTDAQRLGGGAPTNCIAQSFKRHLANQNTNQLVSGTMFLVGGELLIPAGRACNTITLWSFSTGASAPLNQWFCLLKKSDRSLLAITVDDTTTPWLLGSAKALALTSTYTPVADMDVYVGILVRATTVPSLVGIDASNNILAAVAPATSGRSTASLTTPASFTGPAAAPSGGVGALPYVMIS